MKRFICKVFILLFLINLFSLSTGLYLGISWAETDLPGYSYVKKITIDHTKIDENLTNFPLIVNLAENNFDLSKIRADGNDIRFTDSNGNTLSHELDGAIKEYYNNYETSIESYTTTHVSVSRSSNRAHTGTYSAKFDSTGSSASAKLGIDTNAVVHGETIFSFWFNIDTRDSDDCNFRLKDINDNSLGINFERETQSDCYVYYPGANTSPGGSARTGVNLSNDKWYKYIVEFNGANSVIKILDSNGSKVLHSRTINLTDFKELSSLDFSDADGGWIVYIDEVTVSGTEKNAISVVKVPYISSTTDTNIYILW